MIPRIRGEPAEKLVQTQCAMEIYIQTLTRLFPVFWAAHLSFPEIGGFIFGAMNTEQQPEHVSEPVRRAFEGLQSALEGNPPDWLVQLADKAEKEGREYGR